MVAVPAGAVAGVDESAREDGRDTNQMRPPNVEIRPLLRADGSARFSLGNSSVIAAVYGPREPKSRYREVFDRATLEVIVRPRVGMPGSLERQLEGHLSRQLDHIVVHKEYPRTQIQIIVQVVSSDGSIGAVAGNAAFLALLDAGIAMRATALSVSIGVRLDEESMPPGKRQRGENEALRPVEVAILLDPTEAEEKFCDAVVTVGVDGGRNLVVSSLSSGASLDASCWASCVAAGTKACKVLETFLRMSLQKRLETFLRDPV
eukprot:TRINITY_DN23047_c0_g1_i1.p1 TRINITY_DN23047_c0_g1~~TRINITY_DN23047_c0_g1_i1.p1  ORF type:complete len:284 (+),score=43.88 TRINITY_DN23047_c0_g1_i1:69-854(+)